MFKYFYYNILFLIDFYINNDVIPSYVERLFVIIQ